MLQVSATACISSNSLVNSSISFSAPGPFLRSKILCQQVYRCSYIRKRLGRPPCGFGVEGGVSGHADDFADKKQSRRGKLRRVGQFAERGAKHAFTWRSHLRDNGARRLG